MRTLVVSAVFFALCALAKADSQSTQALTTCSVSAFVEAFEAYVVDTFNFVNEVVVSYETAIVEGVKCTKDYDDFYSLVSCIGTTAISFTNTLMPSLQTYLDNLNTDNENLWYDITDCII